MQKMAFLTIFLLQQSADHGIHIYQLALRDHDHVVGLPESAAASVTVVDGSLNPLVVAADGRQPNFVATYIRQGGHHVWHRPTF